MLKKFSLYTLISLFAMSCAKITQLEGGPKDEISPALVSQKPKNDSCNIPVDKKFYITLKFDKNIYLKNPEQIIITPKLKTEKGNEKNFDCFNDDDSVTLVIYSGLEKNTTYSVNFNNTIIGFCNDKTIENQIVTFSTGDAINKNIFSGKVVNTMKLQPLKNGIVCLYNFENFDEVEINGKKKKVHSNIISSKQPDFFTKTDDKGHFKFTNPTPGKYLCCAGESEEGKPYCNPSKNCYGFKVVEVEKNKEVNEVINIVEADITDFKIVGAQNKGRFFELKFSKPIVYYEIKADIKSEFYQKAHIFSQLIDDNIIRIFNHGLHLLDEDNLRIKIIAYDKIGNKLEEKVFINFAPGQQPKDDFKIFISNENLKRNLVDGVKVKISTSLPLLKFDTQKIFFIINEKYPLELEEKDFKLNKHCNEILITKKFDLKNFLDKNDPLHQLSKASQDDFQIDVILENNALENVFKNKNKEVKKKFIYSTKHGKLAGKVVSTKNFTVQLLNEHLELVEESKNKNFIFENLAPGKYIVRALYHKGKEWSCGNIFNLKNPDEVVFYPEIIEVLPNWKKEDITLIDVSLS